MQHASTFRQRSSARPSISYDPGDRRRPTDTGTIQSRQLLDGVFPLKLPGFNVEINQQQALLGAAALAILLVALASSGGGNGGGNGRLRSNVPGFVFIEDDDDNQFSRDPRGVSSATSGMAVKDPDTETETQTRTRGR